MLKGFKEFILRGNVIELAVAVVIGGAFTAIVTGLVEGVFNPVIALIFNADDLAGAGIELRAATADQEAVFLSWGRVISALIQFLLVATVVYFALIVPMNYLKRVSFRKKIEEPAPVEPTPPTELELLIEIRDLLKAQNDAAAAPKSPGAHTA
jgi:large conductance mechanosensitive channel